MILLSHISVSLTSAFFIALVNVNPLGCQMEHDYLVSPIVLRCISIPA